MSSSNKSKSRSTGQPRSAGNEPVTHFKVEFEKSARSEKPPAVVAINNFTRGQIPLPKKPSTNKKPPLTSRTKQTKSDIHFHGDGRKTVDLDRTAIFSLVNPSLEPLNKKAAIKAAEKKGPGKVSELRDRIEQRIANQKGGKKTRKYKKSKKSKTRSKRCCC